MRLFFLFLFFCSMTYADEILAVKPVLNKLGDSTSLSLLVAGTLSTLATQPYDDRIRDDWKNNQQMSKPNSEAGNILGSGVAGVMIVGGQYFFDSEEDHYKNHVRALIWETAAVFLMKYSFGRQRPNSSNYQSFPSGHTATSFASATSLAYSYGWKAAVVAYPLAAFVGASRLADNAHWASDVVAGAFVGIIMARATVSDETVPNSVNQARLVPIISPEFNGLNYSYSF